MIEFFDALLLRFIQLLRELHCVSHMHVAMLSSLIQQRHALALHSLHLAWNGNARR